MNLKKLSIAAMAALTLLSCTKEVEVIKEVPGPAVQGTSRIKLSLSTDGIASKASHYSNTPTDEELLIFNYSVFIFNEQGMLEASLAESPYVGTSQSGQIGYTGPLVFNRNLSPNNLYMDDKDEITLTAGRKYILAIVNAPGSVLEEQNKYLTNNSLTYTLATGLDLPFKDKNDDNNLGKIVGSFYFDDIDDTNYFFENDSTVTGNRGFMMTSKEIIIEDLPSMEDHESAKPIELEVGRAMVKVSLSSALDPTNRQDPNQANGVLEVINYKVINNPDKMYLAPNLQNNGTVLITPYYFETGSLVGNTRYFDSFFSTEYIKVSEEENGNGRTYTYAAENANRTPRKGNSTAAVLYGKYSPNTLTDPDDGSAWTGAAHQLGQDFWRIRDKNTLVYELEYYPSEPDLAALQYNNTDYEAIKYPEGICYYIAYLRNDDRPMAPYSVKRNSYYKIEVEKVTGAGEPDEGGLIVDPDEPIEPETRITVSIKVADWDDVDQKQTL